MENINITDFSAMDVEDWINYLPDPLSPPVLTRQQGYYKTPPDTPPPFIRMNSFEEDEEEIDLESFLKGLTIKQNNTLAPEKPKTLKTFLPVTDIERKLKTIMKMFGSDINTNVKYYERLRRHKGILTDEDKEDIVCVHNNLRKLAVQKIDNLLEKHDVISNELTEYIEAYFETQLNRIRGIHSKT